MKTLLTLLISLSTLTCITAGPQPAPVNPGDPFTPPQRVTSTDAPRVYEHSGEAGPDESFFIVGENLTTNILAWGTSSANPSGKEFKPHVQFLTNGYLAATIPEHAQDGLFMLWINNNGKFSIPILLNVPQPWWCGPDVATAGQTVRIFGRNLARRPDFQKAFVYIAQPGKPGTWCDVRKTAKYDVSFLVPEKLSPGDYEVRLHAGSGCDWGWSEPVKLHIKTTSSDRSCKTVTLRGKDNPNIQQAMDKLSARGGGTVVLPAGHFNFSGTLSIPAGVTLAGSGRDATTIQLVHNPDAVFARLNGSGWNQAPGAVHAPGDTMEYMLDVPQAGEWTVWLRYATDMQQWHQPGVSGNHSLAIDDSTPVTLMNLDNTGGWGSFKWTKSATMKLPAGRHKLTWKNIKGGGISLDAFLFACSPSYVPAMEPPPSSSPTVLVMQAEDCFRFVTKDGNQPGGDRAAVCLSGNGAGLRNLTLLGNSQVNIGVAIRAPQPEGWLTNCTVQCVLVADCDGKQGENRGIFVRYADHSSICSNEFWGRAPLFISGARQTEFINNRLVSVTRFGGNAEAAILGRNETIEQCIIEGNHIASPPGAEAGGPTARRLLWFSTGHGSITRNWIARNGVEPPSGPGADIGAGQARFGGVAGTDQNVGEMILFEGNHRTAFFGPLAGAGRQNVLLPKTVPATPDGRLGSVKREQLAHDAAGNETPFWPPGIDDGTGEPPMSEYYVTVFSGCGQGQTRRVVRRDGEKLLLDRPWNVEPKTGSVVAVATAFHQNLIVGNYAADGMTGIQLWISCVENIISDNTIARQRKPGLFLYANGTTLASSMPRTWNRGISPLFWNVAEGNRIEDCSAGALVTSGDNSELPIEFPRALGNVLRHNSFIRNRTDGVILTSRGSQKGITDKEASVTGTIVEFNVVRDALTAYHAAQGSDATLLRRNHAYFWYPVNNSTNAPVAFQIDREDSTVVLEHNTIEGIHGGHDGASIDLKTPACISKLPQ